MRFRNLLRKRLHIQIGLVDPALPQVQAAGEEAAPSVGGWFSANFGVGNVLAASGLLASLIGGYATLRSQVTENGRRIDSLNARVVSRTEIEGLFRADNERILQLQAGQTLVVNHLLAGCK